MNEPYGRGGTLYVRKFNLDASDYARFVCEMRHQGYVSEFAFARELILQALGACEKKRSLYHQSKHTARIQKDIF